jgi:hypothetical protein
MRDSGESTWRPSRGRSHRSWIAFFGVAAASMATGATVGMNWPKSEVIPVVLVEPGIGGFVPTQGTSIGNTWTKEQVKPVLLVKPGIGGFEPVEGMSIGNTWSKGEVTAVTLTQPSVSGFSAMEFSDVSDAAPTASAPSATLIESQIEGDFNGWEGETIIRLSNGQIWQQSSYHYEYHYAFMPKVLIFKTGGVFRAKVDGTETSVPVTRLK